MKTLPLAPSALVLIFSCLGCANVFSAPETTMHPNNRSGENLMTTPTSDVQRIEFSEDEVPRNLYSLFTGTDAPSYLQYRLPEDYSREKRYPLLLYVPGHYGHPGGDIQAAIDIAGGRDCVVASLPLFKESIDRTEPVEGVAVGFCDYPVLSRAYRTMLDRLYEAVPNIDRDASAMAGFSNGAIAIAILVSSHDEYILDRFHSFCLVDEGMFHLTDLYRQPTRDRRFLILVGDKADRGRDLLMRGAKLVEDLYKLLGVDVESRILPGMGHELTEDCKREIGEWVFDSPKERQGGTGR
jgi:hypothetical protein